MRLLEAARIVRTLGLARDIRWLVEREHVGTPEAEIAAGIAGRVAVGFARVGRKGAPGPDAVRLGRERCTEAAQVYAIACHRRNGRSYRRVMGGSVAAARG